MPGSGRIGRRRLNEHGYIRVCVSQRNREQYEHRLVMESAIGRPLTRSEVVHHINGDTTDNRIENLQLFASHSEHMKSHPKDYRAMQRKGAKAKHEKAIKRLLPGILEGIRALMASGAKPTQRACRSIHGYNSMQRWFPQAKLVAMAKSGATQCVA